MYIDLYWFILIYNDLYWFILIYIVSAAWGIWGLCSASAASLAPRLPLWAQCKHLALRWRCKHVHSQVHALGMTLGYGAFWHILTSSLIIHINSVYSICVLEFGPCVGTCCNCCNLQVLLEWLWPYSRWATQSLCVWVLLLNMICFGPNST